MCSLNVGDEFYCNFDEEAFDELQEILSDYPGRDAMPTSKATPRVVTHTGAQKEIKNVKEEAKENFKPPSCADCYMEWMAKRTCKALRGCTGDLCDFCA